MACLVLGLVAAACFTATFTLLIFLVNHTRPKSFKVKAVFIKWISVEVELQSPEPSRRAADVPLDPSLCLEHAVIDVGRSAVEAPSGDIADRLGALSSDPDLGRGSAVALEKQVGAPGASIAGRED